MSLQREGEQTVYYFCKRCGVDWFVRLDVEGGLAYTDDSTACPGCGQEGIEYQPDYGGDDA